MFDAESWPIVVVFEEGADGAVRALRISERQFSWGRIGGAFERVS